MNDDRNIGLLNDYITPVKMRVVNYVGAGESLSIYLYMFSIWRREALRRKMKIQMGILKIAGVVEW